LCGRHGVDNVEECGFAPGTQILQVFAAAGGQAQLPFPAAGGAGGAFDVPERVEPVAHPAGGGGRRSQLLTESPQVDGPVAVEDVEHPELRGRHRGR
jgi:hypothetical protein